MRIPATSRNAITALALLTTKQHYFVEQLTALANKLAQTLEFNAVEWLRDNGTHGGGLRFEAAENSLFNSASVNVSQIQYEDRPDKAFSSATALSTIIHPQDPLAPSIHLHVSWTELKNGQHYWRLMADLNPAIADQADNQLFTDALIKITGQYYPLGKKQGDDYFYIPTLDKHRGVSHFYLEGFNPDSEPPEQFASTFIAGIIDCYINILTNKLRSLSAPTVAQLATQLDYHTLYFYQVLTLDKGTTAGLLIHDQNDIGTLGSLPSHVNRNLLIEWAAITPSPRNYLVEDLIAVLPKQVNSPVTIAVKKQIAQCIRLHYQHYPINK